jgi:hypothetical protein
MSVRERCCKRSFSPYRYWKQVPAASIQATIRGFFKAWGRPQRLRVDNGSPWGTWSDLPPELALWLIGLDIGMIWNTPRRPQENGVVEPSQGTAKRWAEPQACRSATELQRRLNKADRVQREKYPTRSGHTRLATYPALRARPRRYTRKWEQTHWDLELVMQHLAAYTVARRVDSSGHVRLYNRNRYVGQMHQDKQIYVMFDPGQREWIFADLGGQQLRTCPATEINHEQIVKLKLLHHRPSCRGFKKPTR